MKIINAMKQIKDLQMKAEDLRGKIAAHSADLDFETPLYADQRTQVTGWLQAHSDIMREILRLRLAIQKTNLETQVTIRLGNQPVTKSIAAWVHRRRDLAKYDLDAWSKLTDRNLREGSITQSTGQQKEVKIRRYYDPVQRDDMKVMYKSEPNVIDSELEVVNATTDLIET
jgi:2-succinyl-5-enolpyruvyl-6-hydroxy-3-cyclohexene-1-carboxylate synthase